MNLEPEKNLIAAVIGRALQDAVGDITDVRPQDRGKIRTQARRWFSQKRDGIFSFRWCSAALDLDIDAVRKRIREEKVDVNFLKEQKNDEHSKR
jgi:hypothetical protein